MNNLSEELKKALDRMSSEEITELKEKCSKYSGIGPTVEEYIYYVKNINNGIYNETNTVMKKLRENMTFGESLEELKKGNCVRRANWHCNKFILKQVDADIPHTVVPNMQSLPQEGKKLIGNRDIEYRNQCLMVSVLETKVFATNYVPNWNDIFADDWQLVENEY